jgi:predicted RNase H-like nuclease
MSEVSVLGVDWYPRGWVAVVLTGPAAAKVLVGDDLSALVERVPRAACVAVDMPIGLPATERPADMLARKFVGPRRQSVFATPPAEVLDAESYAKANEIAARLLDGKKISQQAWALRGNINRVGELAERDRRIVEVHPEVSFRKLVGEDVLFPKTSWNGQALRRQALEGAGIGLPDELDEAGVVPVADVLDAAAAAWSARRYARGAASSFPEDAQPGRRQVIWY